MEFLQRWMLVLLAATSVGLFADNPKAPDQKFAAMVIWGTDGDKPDDKQLKDVDPALQEKFKKIFKWKNYYEVSRTNVTAKAGESKKFEISKKCEVKVHLTEKEGMEVEMFGEGKSVYKAKHSMPVKDILILAGDDKNATAWFVVLKPE